MKIAVCDDCKKDILQLTTFLKAHEVKTYSCAETLLADVEEKQIHFDLYLLDIYIEDTMNGIELAKRLRSQDAAAAICFVSTSNDFYREAYDLYAVQYLLKPVCREDVEQLLERVSGNMAREKQQCLAFRWRGKTGTIPYGKILYISSREHTLFIHCTDGTVQECTGKLNEMAVKICGNVFCRCHQSFIVNMYQAESLSGKELFISGSSIPVSRRYYAEVKRRYQEILFEEVE